MPIPDSWSQQSAKMDRKEKSAQKSATRKASGVVLERDIEKAIQQAFRLKHRIILHKVDAGGAGMRSGLRDTPGCYQTGITPGFTDLVGVIPGSGRALFLEVKRPGNKPTPLQIGFMDRRRSEGAVSFWADSVQSALDQFNKATGVLPVASDPGTVSNHG